MVNIYIITFIIGLIVGSFLNVVICRIPIILNKQWWEQCVSFLAEQQSMYVPPIPDKYQQIFNLIQPRSTCINCNTNIAFYDNIPILSYFLLNKRCRSCKSIISIQYPLVELLAAIVSVIALYVFGFTIAALGVAILGWLLLCLSVIDLRYYLLPDNLTLPFLWLGLIFNFFSTFTSLHNGVIGAIVGYLFLWSIYWLFKCFTKKEAMGHGDFKFLALLGAWLGWSQLPIVVLFASILGTIYGILYIRLNKKDMQTPIPFGPFLAFAGWVVLILNKLLDYTGLFIR